MLLIATYFRNPVFETKLTQSEALFRSLSRAVCLSSLWNRRGDPCLFSSGYLLRFLIILYKVLLLWQFVRFCHWRPPRYHVYAYVCTYVVVYVCTYLCVYICMFVCMYYLSMYVFTYVCMYVRTYICTYLSTYVCTYVGGYTGVPGGMCRTSGGCSLC